MPDTIESLLKMLKKSHEDRIKDIRELSLTMDRMLENIKKAKEKLKIKR